MAVPMGARYQRGHGLGSMLNGLLRRQHMDVVDFAETAGDSVCTSVLASLSIIMSWT